MTRHSNSTPASARGFTLVELMVGVVIVGILAAIAIPSYQNFVKSGHRSAAQNHMLQMATTQTQYLADARAYADDTTINGLVPPPAELAARYTFASAPVPGVAPLPSFKIVATPKGKQAPDVELSIDHTGEKLPSGKW